MDLTNRLEENSEKRLIKDQFNRKKTVLQRAVGKFYEDFQEKVEAHDATLDARININRTPSQDPFMMIVHTNLNHYTPHIISKLYRLFQQDYIFEGKSETYTFPIKYTWAPVNTPI